MAFGGACSASGVRQKWALAAPGVAQRHFLCVANRLPVALPAPELPFVEMRLLGVSALEVERDVGQGGGGIACRDALLSGPRPLSSHCRYPRHPDREDDGKGNTTFAHALKWGEQIMAATTHKAIPRARAARVRSNTTILDARREERLSIRTSAEQKELLKRAALSRGTDLSAFVLQASLEQARQAVVEESVVVFSSKGYEALCRVMDEPVEPNAALRSPHPQAGVG